MEPEPTSVLTNEDLPPPPPDPRETNQQAALESHGHPAANEEAALQSRGPVRSRDPSPEPDASQRLLSTQPEQSGTGPESSHASATPTSGKQDESHVTFK